MRAVINLLFWGICAMKIARVQAISPSWATHHEYTAKDGPNTNLINQTERTNRPRHVTSTPETSFALNFSIVGPDGFSLLRRFSYLASHSLSQSNGKS